MFLVSSPRIRLDAVRELKEAGYGASAPKEDEHEGGWAVFVADVPPDKSDEVMDILRTVDPSVQRVP